MSEGTNLLSLPVELLYSIFSLSLSSALPSTCRWLRQVYRNAPFVVKVEHILEMWHLLHISNLKTWRDTRYRRCLCGYVKGNLHPAPTTRFADRDSVLRPGLIPVCCPSFLPAGAGADPISFAARFRICTPEILIRFEMRLGEIESLRLVVQDCMLRLGTLPHLEPLAPKGMLTGVELPKRIFRSLKHTHVGVETLKRKRGQDEAYDPTLLKAVGGYRPTETHAVGWLPEENALATLLLLLTRYGADPNSHSGFPLAMTVHSDAWTLACLLLSFGADPARKDGLAVQIAVRKGGMDGLRALIERDERTEARWARAQTSVRELVKGWIKLRPHPGYRHCCGTAEESKDSSAKRRRLPDRLALDSRLLREAIKSEAWEVVSYLMQEKKIIPDMKTIKLMDKKGM